MLKNSVFILVLLFGALCVFANIADANSRRSPTSLSLVLIDISSFKKTRTTKIVQAITTPRINHIALLGRSPPEALTSIVPTDRSQLLRLPVVNNTTYRTIEGPNRFSQVRNNAGQSIAPYT